jgi:hypothetical protein
MASTSDYSTDVFDGMHGASPKQEVLGKAHLALLSGFGVLGFPL